MLRRQLLDSIPDEPANIDTRGVLLEAEAFFGDVGGCVAVQRGGRLLVAIGSPDQDTVAAARAVAAAGSVLVTRPEFSTVMERLLGVPAEHAILHTVGGGGVQRPPGLPEAVPLPTGVPLDGFSNDVRAEIADLPDGRPVIGVLEGGLTVSVCYPAVVTERFWDVSIETLEGYRRGGRAAAAFLRLEEEMSSRRLQPVWGAAVGNRGSLRLAEKLGFEPVAEVVAFTLRQVSDATRS